MNRQQYNSKINFNEFTPSQQRDIEEMCRLADDMAASAVAMNTQQGYQCFITAREQYRSRIKEMSSLYVRVDLN